MPKASSQSPTPAEDSDSGSNSDSASDDAQGSKLSEVESKLVDFFVQLTKLLAMPKSVGEIYGVLFASSKPLSVADITAKLGISKATASYALRFLANINAIAITKEFGVRHDLFTAETSLRKLAFGFLSERVDPFLEERDGDIESLTQLSADLPEDNTDDTEQKRFLKSRVKMLADWQRNARKVLPIVRGFFKMTS